MNDIDYRCFSRVAPEDFLPILNEEAVRMHLIEHAAFDLDSASLWITGKIQLDAQPGCRIRAVYVNDRLAGWCGIQPDPEGFEIAIVLASDFWGIGRKIYTTMLGWARDLGHEVVLIHLLDSRPTYRHLARSVLKVRQSELMGRRFTTYYVPT